MKWLEKIFVDVPMDCATAWLTIFDAVIFPRRDQGDYHAEELKEWNVIK